MLFTLFLFCEGGGGGVVYAILNSFRVVVKTTANRLSVYTIPDSFRAAESHSGLAFCFYYTGELSYLVKTIADSSSVYTKPGSFRAVVKAIADL